MLAMIPDKALFIFALLFVIAVGVGIVTDIIHDRIHKKNCNRPDHSDCGVRTDCSDGYVLHEDHHEHDTEISSGKPSGRHFGWKRITLAVGLAIFIAALATGKLGHDHGSHAADAHEGHVHSEACTHDHDHHHHAEESTLKIDLLSEDWMNVLFAGLSLIFLFVLIFASDHFVEEHIWNHIVKKHLPTIFAWTFGVLLVMGLMLQHIDISRWISDNTVLMILLATLIGIIPESGPHMIFVTLYAAGVVPFPVLLASCISQDGHASIPLLAENRMSFAWAKLINCIVALAAGLTAMLFM